ncbi:MAG: selenocysteine lyase/cysteine desulfurase [Candidatus Endobugula sp.]|jgi:selenocysteine lyase/cysteine desulfurase
MSNALIKRIQQSVIGSDLYIETTFGKKPLVYADYTASGRSLGFIEDYIRDHVLPFYANSHTETSYTGAQTTALREQAREMIRDAVNGNEEDAVILCGSGATAAINKLIDIMNIRLPADVSDQYALLDSIPQEERPVVFLGGYEHHSNELPWRESIADVITIPLDSEGQLDLIFLESALEQYSARSLKIGTFSAASNVTGLKTDVNRVNALLKQHNALAFWDYAAAAPYVGIDMNPTSTGSSSTNPDGTKEGSNLIKDAVFISPHKFVGGPGTPGVLVVKKALLTNRVPAMPGGGTVVYVTPEDHVFTTDLERKEEGGTPAIVESVRAGLVFALQQQVGTATIEAREEDFVRRALDTWKQSPNVDVLGNTEADRLAIVSLRIKHDDKFLHYGFVAALLNDVFGIQARGGCSCAGPYGHTLLGMDMAYSKAIESEILNGNMLLRPGWVRVNFNYFIDEKTYQYLVGAIQLVAEHGWRLLPFYHFDQASGVWRYQDKKIPLSSDLNDIHKVTMGEMLVQDSARYSAKDLAGFLAKGEQELLRMDRCETKLQYSISLSEKAEKLRWFVLPQDIKLM